jgi:hypothetical protein
LNRRLDFDAGVMRPDDLVFCLVDLFTTLNGSWEVGGQPAPYGIEQWAQDAYLFPIGHPRNNPGAGGDHNSFAMCLDPAGNPYPDAGFLWASNGAQHLQPPTDPSQVVARNAEGSHGWANIPLFNNVQPGGHGWTAGKFGIADLVDGIGMPNNWHVSTFSVWQAMTWRNYNGEPEPEPDPGPGQDFARKRQRLHELAVAMARREILAGDIADSAWYVECALDAYMADQRR